MILRFLSSRNNTTLDELQKGLDAEQERITKNLESLLAEKLVQSDGARFFL